MFFYLLSLSAENYILAYDPNRNPYIARETFQEGCHLLLYDQLLQFTSTFETEEEFINLVMIILVYMRKQKNDKKSDISADEIKLLLMTSITTKFGLGEVSISSLELLADFDEDLVTHFHSLYENGIYQIKPSVYKHIKDYTPADYLINRSMAFIGLAYGTCLYQLTLFQVTYNRWHFKDPCLFIEVIEKYVKIEDAVKKIISSKHHDYTDYKSSLEYLLFEAHYFEKAHTYFWDCKPYKNIIVSVYSNNELFYAFMRRSIYKIGVFNIPLTIESVLSHSENLERMDGMYKDLLKLGIDMNFIAINRPFIKYELFFIFTIVNDYNDLTSFKHNIYRLRDANEWINTFVDLALQA